MRPGAFWGWSAASVAAVSGYDLTILKYHKLSNEIGHVFFLSEIKAYTAIRIA